MISWRNKILLAVIEGTYGTDAAPTGAANGILAMDVRLNPMEGNDVDRNLDLPHFGNSGTLPAELHASLSFKVEMAPSGAAGTAPAWGPLLRACGVAEVISAGVSVAYNPITDDPESATIYLWVGGTKYALTGARGNAKMTVNAQGIPYLEFEFKGLFTQPSETARDTPTLTAFQKPKLASTTNTPTFTLAATPFVMRSFGLDLGNQIENRFLIGSDEILITDKNEVIETTVNAVALTTFNPYALAAAQTDVAAQLVHGTTAGNIATLAVAKAQLMRPQGLENSQNVTEWPLRLSPLPTAGNDQWTLTLT